MTNSDLDTFSYICRKLRCYISVLAIVLIAVTPITLMAQSDSTMYKNTAQFEALGLGRYASLGFETLVHRGSHFNYYLKTGFSMVRFANYENKFNPDIIIPLLAEAELGKKSSHLLMSAGLVYTAYSTFSVAKGSQDRERELSLATSMAYRYRRAESRWQYTASIYPIWDDFEQPRLWGGVSVGYRFNRGKL